MTEITDPKQRIQAAAHGLVMKYGIRTVSMDDIAATVGMSKKTLYQYYRDKDELVNSIIEKVLSENQCTCNVCLTQATNAVHEVFLTIEMMLDMFKDMNPSVMFDLQKYHPQAYGLFLKHKSDFIYNAIKSNLEKGIKEELYRPDINVEVLSRFRIESMFIPFNPDFQRSLSKYSLLQMEEQIMLNFLFGMVTLKGYKLVTKYLEQRNKNRIVQ